MRRVEALGAVMALERQPAEPTKGILMAKGYMLRHSTTELRLVTWHTARVARAVNFPLQGSPTLGRCLARQTLGYIRQVTAVIR